MATKNPKLTLVNGRIGIFVAGAILCVAFILAAIKFNERIGTIPVDGVVKFVHINTGDRNTVIRPKFRSAVSYLPTFTFTDQNGIEHSAPANDSGKYFNFPIGSHHAISYDPENFDYVFISEPLFIYIFPLGLAGFGGLMLLLSLGSASRAKAALAKGL